MGQPMPTYHIETLGCKLNFSESATMGKLLEDAGYRRATAGEEATVCVVNTCSVTDLADRKCRQHIRALLRRHPGTVMVVTGCYAQLKAAEIAAMEGVDIVLGSEQKLDVVSHVESFVRTRLPQMEVTRTMDMRRFVPSCERGDRTRYWLKVQDGCDYYCSYCTIPMARGRSRSGTIASLVEQAREVAREGGREIVLTGVNIGDFGKNTGERLLDLVRALDEVDGIARYRISSIEPDLLSDELIDFCAGSRAFMPHFHIPLQSGSNAVLRLMRRHYDRELFAAKVERCRAAMPHCFIGVDVMVGTRGETDELFDESYRFVASLPLQHLHVFPYSERPGTVALRIPHVVPQAVKNERAAAMIALSDEKQRAWVQSYLGTCRPVLLEQPHGDKPMMGFTDNYIRVAVPCDPRLVNRVVTARLDTLNPDMSVNATVVTPPQEP
ncbi:MAG: tRNA (N(6)-L-threonylcarbamoyladenosine(37)-C(2))-methylthiotransferase MtaB [Muribaculaceae bacterium]|nr:tRNA (N(6)-L-threonylcarbamoyladenosine(37)-C(2))-methylthiotransferase MtaB [Muribaculaceae bacterium]MBQ4006163.1 tRNA (N(6)-L-threonylcarbamoyladenosine(37)-C(2))-methylthiotransferase MtaB [Muribaculaceae bacterium]